MMFAVRTLEMPSLSSRTLAASCSNLLTMNFPLGGSFVCKPLEVGLHFLLAAFVLLHDLHGLEEVRVDLVHLDPDGC